MNNERIEELLLTLIKDMAEVKSKLNSIEQQQFGARIDRLEGECREHSKTIRSLEKRNDTMEQFVRNNLTDARKTQTGVFISMGMALFSAVIGIIMNLL